MDKPQKQTEESKAKISQILLTSYAFLVSVIVLTLLYLAKPYVAEHPKTTAIMLVLLMLTTLGVWVRTMLELSILWPMLKIAKGRSKAFLTCPFIFLAAMLVAITFPWLNGVSDFKVWHWISAIAFTMFNFETFYAFVGATLRIYNSEEDIEDTENLTKQRQEKVNSGMKISLFRRMFMSIPHLRHRAAKNAMHKLSDDHELLNIVNRSVSYMIARNITTLINEGKMDVSTICDCEYHRKMIVKMFGNKARSIAEQIRCEKAILKSFPLFSVYLFTLPSSRDIGQNDIVAYVINPSRKAYSYNWEWSVNGTRMICTWESDKHLNFGVCNNKVDFCKNHSRSFR